MKMLAALLALSLLPSSVAASGTAPLSPLLGSWAVDVSRLPVPPEARPKSVTMTFSERLGGKWETQVEIIAKDGSTRRMTSAYALDGTAAPIDGDRLEADTAAVKMPTTNVLVLALAKGSSPASTRIYTVAPDGREMVETAVYFDDNGKAVMRTNYFNRLR
jgi:hypothetical protein